MSLFHRGKRKSQIAVIVTFVIVLLVLASMMLVNVGQLSSAKTQASMASDKAALALASQLSVHVNTLYEAIDYYKANYWITNGDCGIDFGATIAFLFDAARQLFPYYFASPVTWIWKLGVMVATRLSAGMNAMQYTSYDGFRENAIFTVLSSLNRDTAKVKRQAPGSFVFVDDDGVQFDLSGTMLGASLARSRSNYTDRFSAWYNSKRVKQVSDEALRPAIDAYIRFVTDITFIEKWDQADWLIKDLTLKAGNLPGFPIVVTNAPLEWTIGSAGSNGQVKVVGRITDPNKDLFHALFSAPQDFIDWLTGHKTYPKGFLTGKFIDLTQRLINAGYTDITYSKANVSLPFLGGVLWDHRQIYKVVDDITGFLLRSMELLNLPLSERLIQLPSWLPLLYDISPGVTHPATPAQDIYDRLYEDQQLVLNWIHELEQVDIKLHADIPPDHGYNSQCGDTDYPASQCDQDPCCCSDCSCCCDPEPCTWLGPYCTGTCSPPVCTNGDLYSLTHCPTANDVQCPCGGCGYNNGYDPSCNFQGDFLRNNTSGPTEVGQAVEILNAFNNVLTQAMIQIRDLGNRSAAMLMPAPGSLLLKMRNEGVYGWKDKSGGMHVIRAKVAGYPDFMGASGFPYLKEYEGIGFLGFEKCWQVIGQQAGDVHITASRYDSDIPSGWWSFRYRANPLQPEFDKAQLGQLIGQVQLPSAGPVWDGTKYELNAGEWPDTTDTSFVNLMNVSVSSGTKAHYGRNKTDIYINKEQ